MMNLGLRTLTLTLASALAAHLSGCGGGSAPSIDGSLADTELPALQDDAPLVTQEPVLEPMSATATYAVTVNNFWGADEFPQEFPQEAHLSLWGGATHNEAVSFWELGEIASKGIEDVAEAGLIDILLFDEVVPAIRQGTADSMIEVREYTDPAIAGVPGTLTFTVVVNETHPLVTMVSMLGPSPDWFVGVSGLSLQSDDEITFGWLKSLTVSLPLYDGGSKSDVVPVMGGPDIIPPNPISLVAYDETTGVYRSTEEEQIVAELVFLRTE